MSKSNVLEYEWLRAAFNGTAVTNLTATGGSTSLWVSMHTADPGEAGSTANEGGYAAYARVETDRSTAGWAVTSNASTDPASCSPVSDISFPQNTATSTGTFTYAAIWPSSNASSTACLFSGAISPSVNFSQNVTPQLSTASAITEQ